MSDADTVDREARHLAGKLASLCKEAAASKRAPTFLRRNSWCNIFHLQPQYQFTICRHLTQLLPVTTLLQMAPMPLHLPCLQTLLQASSPSPPHMITPPVRMLKLDLPGIEQVLASGKAPAPLTPAAVNALVVQIPQLPALSHFSLQDQQLSDDTLANVIAALQCHTQLTYLNLQGNASDNVSTHMLTNALLRWPRLQHLQLQIAASRDSTAIFAEGLSVLTELTALHACQDYASNSSFGKFVAMQTRLRCLHAFDSAHVRSALASLRQLTHLELHAVHLTEAPQPMTDALSAAMSSMTDLRWLALPVVYRPCLGAVPFGLLQRLQHLHLANFLTDSTIPDDVEDADLGHIDDEDQHANIAPPPPEDGHTHGLRAMACLSQLTHLSFGDITWFESPRPCDKLHFCRVIASLTGLQELDLGASKLLSCYGGSLVVAAFLRINSLTMLSYMWPTVLTHAQPVRLAPSQLQHLQLEVGGVNESAAVDRLVQSFQALSCLTSLSCKGFGEPDNWQGVFCVSRLVREATTLQSLCTLQLETVWWTGFEEFSKMCECLPNLTRLTTGAFFALETDMQWDTEWPKLSLGSVRCLEMTGDSEFEPEAPLNCFLRAMGGSNVEVLDLSEHEGTWLRTLSYNNHEMVACLSTLQDVNIRMCRLPSGLIVDSKGSSGGLVEQFNARWAGAKYVQVG